MVVFISVCGNTIKQMSFETEEWACPGQLMNDEPWRTFGLLTRAHTNTPVRLVRCFFSSFPDDISVLSWITKQFGGNSTLDSLGGHHN